MNKSTILCAVFSVGLFSMVARDGAPVTSNHQLTDSSTVSSGNLSSGLMDLETPNDGGFELDGTIKNSTEAIRKIKDVKIWFEKNDGTKLTTTNGSGPISELKTSNGGTPTNVANLVSRSHGVSVFNLADTPKRGQATNYGAQVDAFVEPLNYKIKMSFSQKKETTGKHYEIIGHRGFTAQKTDYTLDGIAPTTRTGVLVSVKNVDGSDKIVGAYVEITSGHSDIEFTGGFVWNKDDEVIPGTTLTVSHEGKRITVDGLSLSNPQIANLWLDLNRSYVETTSFKIHATFE